MQMDQSKHMRIPVSAVKTYKWVSLRELYY